MSEIDWSVLARYAAGECTADERLAVERWLAESPAHAAQLVAMREVAAAGDRTTTADERRQVLAQVRQKVARATAAEEASRVRALTPRRYFQPLLRIAAVLVAVLGASILGYQLLQDRPAGVETPAFRTFTTPRAGRLSLRLPDGTLAELAPATTLRLPETYGTNDRTVELTGEAVFTVTHDASRPFAVRTARLVAVDLGTRFVVRAYPDDATTDVVVAEGIVAVTRDEPAQSETPDSVVLHRGGHAQLTADDRLVVARDVALDSYLGWTEGRLVFRGAPLGDAVMRLGRWHDIDIRLASPELAELRFSASFEQTEPSAGVLQVIADALDLEVERDGKVYTLYAK